MNNQELVFLPVGGVGEIGMNLSLYGYGLKKHHKWIMVDCGITFAGPQLPGVEIILPDINYIESRLSNLLAIIITHAHEDHYGALLKLWPKLKVPVYCTPFTSGMLEAKRQWGRNNPEIPLKIFEPGDQFCCGPFDVTSVAVTHSIPEAVSLVINTPLGRVIHTGDWNLDSNPALGSKIDKKTFQKFGDDGVLALVCDSTNAMRIGKSPSELEVEKNLCKIINNAKGRVFITTFSSNIGRIQTITKIADQAGKKVILLGRSINTAVEVATNIGYFDEFSNFLERNDFNKIDPDKLVVMITGSQGESRSSLIKLARNEYRDIHFSSGDLVVFSSRIIPGNEKPIADIKNMLINAGVCVIDNDHTLVHVSGHPRQGELLDMYQWVRPSVIIPVHGEPMHLNAHKKLINSIDSTQSVVVQNGDVLRLAPGSVEIVEKVSLNQVFLDGHIISDNTTVNISDRKQISYAGCIGVSIVLNRKGMLAAELEIKMLGIPKKDQENNLMYDIVHQIIMGTIQSIPSVKRQDQKLVREAVQRSIRSILNKSWGKKPITNVFVSVV